MKTFKLRENFHKRTQQDDVNWSISFVFILKSKRIQQISLLFWLFFVVNL